MNFGKKVEELKERKQERIEQIKKLSSLTVIQSFEKEIEDIELEIALTINKRDTFPFRLKFGEFILS